MTRRSLIAAICGLAIIAISSNGCQGNGVKKTLPDPGFSIDDVQYFAPGPEAKLSREAAAMKAYKADQSLRDETSEIGQDEPSKAAASIEG